MATELQKRAFKEVLKKTSNNQPFKMGEVMLEAGYKKSIARTPKALEKSKGWEILKAKYLNDEKALQTFNDLADKKNEDKDNRLKASVEIMKLKDRYPAGRVKIGAFEDRDKILE